MNNTFYKGYIGSVHYSAVDNVFFGKVEGVDDLITFEGNTVQELKEAFHYVVDEHVKDCMNEGIAVEKSCSEIN
jgi:predicted HicB family RNase H-like nuclease